MVCSVPSFVFTTTVLVPESTLVTVPWTALTTSSAARSGRISRGERIKYRSTRLGMEFSSRAFGNHGKRTRRLSQGNPEIPKERVHGRNTMGRLTSRLGEDA